MHTIKILICMLNISLSIFYGYIILLTFKFCQEFKDMLALGFFWNKDKMYKQI